MKIMNGILFTFSTILGLIYPPKIFAQKQADIETVINEFRQLQKTYMSSSSLSFNIKYRYTNEHRDDITLDSVMGSMQIQNGNYRYILDSTETIVNTKYQIILFKEDRLMYIAKPTSADMVNDPLNLLDSTITNMKGISCFIQQDQTFKTIHFVFPDDFRYKSLDFVINLSTGYLEKTIYIVKTEELLDQQQVKSVDESKYEKYAKVETSFSNYTKDTIDTSFFDDKKYFVRQGNNVTTTDLYKQYKIFVGSPNL